MRTPYLAVLLASLAAACGKPPAAAPPPESVVQFLLSSASNDFYAHPAGNPGRFRNVRIGHIVTAGGEKNYRLCGEFLPTETGATKEWTRFATLKMSDYEQWIGPAAAAYCGSEIIWDSPGDLSSALQNRLDSLRKG